MSSSRLHRYVDDVFMDIDPRCYPPPLVHIPEIPVLEPVIPQYDFNVEHKAIRDYETYKATSSSLEASPMASNSQALEPTSVHVVKPIPQPLNSTPTRFVTSTTASFDSTPTGFVTPTTASLNSTATHLVASNTVALNPSPTRFVRPPSIPLTSTPTRFITPAQVPVNSTAAHFAMPSPISLSPAPLHMNWRSITSLPTSPIVTSSVRPTSSALLPKPVFLNGILEPSRVSIVPQVQKKKEVPKPVLNTFEEFEQKPNLFDLLEMRTIDDKTVLEQVLMASVAGSTNTGVDQNLPTSHTRGGSVPASLPMGLGNRIG